MTLIDDGIDFADAQSIYTFHEVNDDTVTSRFPKNVAIRVG